MAYPRRSFLKSATFAPLAFAGSQSCAQDRSRPRVLYSNDTTHITSCESPWRNPKDGFTDEHLRASIREAAGVDAHILQPGLGWIPWWSSELYSPQAHYEEFLGSFGITKLPTYARYLLAGGDLVRTHLEECRAHGIEAFISIRLNDGHHVRGLVKALAEKKPAHDMSRFFWENYARYRIGPDPTDWGQGVLNWAFPEVAAHKLALIRELVSHYPIDGLELDFLRHWNRFAPNGTTLEERAAITRAFVSEVRAALDSASAADGKRRTLAIRVPAKIVLHPDQGIDLPALADAGVDLVTLSWSYFTFQDDSIREAKALIPDTPVYAEMTHTTYTGKALGGSGTQPYLRTTAEQFYTTADLAYEHGAAGVSLFNFPYYRAHTTPAIGPFTEPPFHVLPKLHDRDFLAKQPRWYFVTAARKDPVLPGLDLPALLQRNETRTFSIEANPLDGVHRDGLVRLRSDEAIADRGLSVTLNEVELAPVAFVAHPLPHPYEAFSGKAEEFRTFACPVSLVRRGKNRLTVTLESGIRVRLVFVDLVLPA